MPAAPLTSQTQPHDAARNEVTMAPTDRPWSNELQAFLDTHSTFDSMLPDIDALPESVARELCIYLTTQEVLGDLERDGYIRHVPALAPGDWE
jgi:hypothetical protein